MSKNIITFFLSIYMIAFFLLYGCTSEKRIDSSLIHIDLSGFIPEKEIKLEDIADIEYLQLELDNDFLYNEPPMIITSEKIITINWYNGDVLIFSRQGKPLSKFNHKGNGPEDYSFIGRIIYDQKSDDFFVKSDNKIIVYSASGEFKKTIQLFEGSFFINEILNFDSETFLLYDDFNIFSNAFLFISKEDGSVVDSVNMPKGKKNSILLSQTVEKNVITLRAPAYHIVKNNDEYLLTDFSIDTVYLLSSDKVLLPVLVRKPAIQSMDPVVYLNSYLEAGDFVFVSVITVKNENGRLPITYLMNSKNTDSVYRQKITLTDYKGKLINLSPETIANTQDSKLGLIVLSLVELQDANRENKISGKLKELVDNSDDDGNDIYMLLHFK